MKIILQTVLVAFSMYSRIPMPQVTWNEKNMRYSLVVFPAVGAVIAAALYLLFYLFGALHLSPVFFAAAAVFAVVLLTGGLHLDGYCDTVDALSSNKEREEKLRILKDPHTGAFAVIYTAAVLILQFGAWYQMFFTPALLLIVLIGFPLSRSLAAFALVTLPCARSSGLASAFAGNSSKRAVKAILAVLILLCFAAMAWLHAAAAILSLLLLAGLSFWFYRMVGKQFGGMTGDLAGFYIVACETLILAGLAIMGGIVL